VSATVAIIRPRVPLTPAEVDALNQWTEFSGP
jgi:hypothetical protein